MIKLSLKTANLIIEPSNKYKKKLERTHSMPRTLNRINRYIIFHCFINRVIMRYCFFFCCSSALSFVIRTALTQPHLKLSSLWSFSCFFSTVCVCLNLIKRAKSNSIFSFTILFLSLVSLLM